MKTCGECPMLRREDDGDDGMWYWCKSGLEGVFHPDDSLCAVGRIMAACHAQRDRAIKAERRIAELEERLNDIMNPSPEDWQT